MFRINNIDWNIKFVNPHNPVLMRDNGDFSVGCCNNYDKTIYLSDELNGFFLKKVLSHELTHAAMFSYNISLPIMIEEHVADIVATYGKDILSLADLIYQDIKKDRYQFY